MTKQKVHKMKRYVIRHGHTGVKRAKRGEFGVEGPPLSELGRQQAAALKQKLTELGIDPNTEPVAVSELIRTHQTADLAGFKNLIVKPVLNEVQTGLPHEEFIKLFMAEKVAPAVLRRAQQVLDNPPAERVWVMHGLLIIGLRELLGVKAQPFDPEFCSILQLNI